MKKLLLMIIVISPLAVSSLVFAEDPETNSSSSTASDAQPVDP